MEGRYQPPSRLMREMAKEDGLVVYAVTPFRKFVLVHPAVSDKMESADKVT